MNTVDVSPRHPGSGGPPGRARGRSRGVRSRSTASLLRSRRRPLSGRAPARRKRVTQLSLGVMARSLKENERRLPLHPHHLSRIPDDLRGRIYLERDYGESFGVSDAQLKDWVAGVPDPRAARRGVRRHPAAQADAQRHRRDARRAGPLGLAALRAGRRTHPDRHRPEADPDRVRGDEPLAAATARSACTCSTRTTSSPATARCCTPCRSPGRPVTTGVGCARWSSASARPPAVR